LGSQNVLEVNEPFLIIRPDDGPIGLKHVALYVVLVVIIDVLDGNILCIGIWNTSGQIKLSSIVVGTDMNCGRTTELNVTK
jgi:hypothetical protein